MSNDKPTGGDHITQNMQPEQSGKNQAYDSDAAPDTDLLFGQDPFDEPLDNVFNSDDQLVLDDVYFEAAKNSVTVAGMVFSFLQPPYMNFSDQNHAKKKMKEAYNHGEYLLLYGYSGAGKTTIQEQLRDRYPVFIKLIDNFDELSPIQLIVTIGEMIGISLIQRGSQVSKIIDHLKAHPGYMFMFDNVSLTKPTSVPKLEMLRTINEKAHVPILVSGVKKLYDDLYSDKKFPSTCSIVSRMDECKLEGMSRSDAANYLTMVSKVENVNFTYPAHQALISTAVNEAVGGINAFTTIIGRCITMRRGIYYTSGGRTLPDKTKCIRPAVPNGKNYPGAELILTPPITPERLTIDEYLVADMLSDYKSHFPKLEKKKTEDSTEDNEPIYYTSSAG